ncbi:MAG: hypothetical protein [Podoviridae sp. ctg2L5]|nr:MAG: hypothetical protein [Podoviridae sp. ctg2L5]
MEREKPFDAAQAANEFVVNQEENYLQNLWDEYFYYAQIPSMDCTESDTHTMNEILDKIEREEIRIGIKEDSGGELDK